LALKGVERKREEKREAVGGGEFTNTPRDPIGDAHRKGGVQEKETGEKGEWTGRRGEG